MGQKSPFSRLCVAWALHCVLMGRSCVEGFVSHTAGCWALRSVSQSPGRRPGSALCPGLRGTSLPRPGSRMETPFRRPPNPGGTQNSGERWMRRFTRSPRGAVTRPVPARPPAAQPPPPPSPSSRSPPLLLLHFLHFSYSFPSSALSCHRLLELPPAPPPRTRTPHSLVINPTSASTPGS